MTDPADTRWIAERLVDHPWETLTDPFYAEGSQLSASPRTFILCTQNQPHSVFVERARSEPGWRVRELDAGHGAMITAPDALARLLLEVA